jgi:hypothetical protein
MRIPFLRRRQTRTQRLTEALVQLVEKWAKQK